MVTIPSTKSAPAGRSAGGSQRSRFGASGSLDRAGREQRRALVAHERPMIGGRPHPVEPGAPVLVTRRGEAAARQLLGVEPERRPLRRVAALGQRPGNRFGFEMSAETGEIAERSSCAPVNPQLVTSKRARPRWEPRPRGGQGLATRPAQTDPLRSVMIDVDVDLVGYVDVGGLAAEAEIARKTYSSTSTTMISRTTASTPPPPPPPPFPLWSCVRARHVLGHGNLPVFAVVAAKRTNRGERGSEARSRR